MGAPRDVAALVQEHLRDPATGWAIGGFGAIAEFHRDAEEPADIAVAPRGGRVVTGRGALCVDLSAGPIAAPYEVPSARRDHWLHGVNLCLDAATATMAQRRRLTELGPDSYALRPQDRAAILFDMGLGLVQADVCVRTADANLIRLLRDHCGGSLLDPENPAMAAIKRHSPHRVFLSRLGRAEVYQQIGSTARGIPTPQGPHTHVLPKLLAAGRTHAATIPVPDGRVPCLTLFPPNPVFDENGRPRRFDRAAHDRFQRLVQRYGDPALRAVKDRTVQCVRSGDGPAALDGIRGRHERAAVRVTLRQLRQQDGDSPLLETWRAAFDAGGSDGPNPMAH